MVRGRCKATNLCAYCAKLAAVENTEMLALDALEGDAPQVWMVLTTSVATVKTEAFYRAREKLMTALRDRFGRRVEYSSLLEFTTGYGPRSGGRRRPHWNVLLKGVTPEDVAEISAIVNAEWCPRVKGKPRAQYVAPVGDAAALMQYVALHFQKESQAPPAGFKGQRFNCSRGYFGDRTRREMRDAARASLRSKRALRRALQEGYQGQEAEDLAAEELADAEATVWTVYFEKEDVWSELARLLPPTGDISSGTNHLTPAATAPVPEQSALFDGSTQTSTPQTTGSFASADPTPVAGGSRADGSGSSLLGVTRLQLLAMGGSWREIRQLEAGPSSPPSGEPPPSPR